MQCGQKGTHQTYTFSLFPLEWPKFIQIRLIVNLIAFKLCNRNCCCGTCPLKIHVSNFAIVMRFIKIARQIK